MCNKDISEKFVTCKKCSHPAKLYWDTKGGCIKASKDAPAVPLNRMESSPLFYTWVSVVCEKNPKCKKHNIPVFLSKDDFYDLKLRPCCSVHKQEMKPEIFEKSIYIYRCEICGEKITLVDWLRLPILE